MRLLAIEKQYDYKSLEEFKKHEEKMRDNGWFVIQEVYQFSEEPDSHGNLYSAKFATDTL